MRTQIAVVGLGKIALDQHIPAINKSRDWQLAATVSSGAGVWGVNNYATIEELLLNCGNISVVSLCVPPAPRFDMAVAIINSGLDLMLEKPPGATLAECDILVQLAEAKGVSIYTTWHSREADQVDRARTWLADKKVTGFSVQWCEDVRRWHPDQHWIWQPGGMGVLDSGINALSILTKILPARVRVVSAALEYPENRQTPIAANVSMQTVSGALGEVVFDWRVPGDPIWNMEVSTDDGLLELRSGGTVLVLDGRIDAGSQSTKQSLDSEYPRLYASMHALVLQRRSDVDFLPLQLTADIFSVASRSLVAPFEF